MVGTTRRRTATQRWFIATVAAVAVGGVVAGGFFLARSATDGEAEAATSPAAAGSTEGPPPAAVVTLEVGGAAAKCARPIDPEHLKEADAVFAATVTGLQDRIAQLEVTRTFQGEPGAEVQLRQRGNSSEALSGTGDFSVGRSYLITALDGDVADCLSGPADDPSLREAYQGAFPDTAP